MIEICIVKRWETSILVIEIKIRVSIGIEVYLRLVIGFHWPKKSVPTALLVVSKLTLLAIALLLQLCIDAIIISSLFLNHSCFRSQIRPGKMMINKLFSVSEVMSKNESSTDACIACISSEEFPGSSHGITIWVVMNPSLIWNYCNTTLVPLSSASNHHGKGPCESSSSHEV